jgi:hypothetical protein
MCGNRDVAAYLDQKGSGTSSGKTANTPQPSHGKIEYEQQALPLYYAWPACQHKTMLPACCAYYVYKKNN